MSRPRPEPLWRKGLVAARDALAYELRNDKYLRNLVAQASDLQQALDAATIELDKAGKAYREAFTKGRDEAEKVWGFVNRARQRVDDLRDELDAAQDRFDTLCGTLAGFLDAMGNGETMRVIKDRNEKLMNAAERFAAALEDFEEAACVSLPSVNDVLSMWLDRHPIDDGWSNVVDGAEGRVVKGRAEKTDEWEHHASKCSNPWDVRAIPSVGMTDLLKWLRQSLEPEGQYGSDNFRHPWIQTPARQDPRGPVSAGAWWSIETLEMVRVAHGERFNDLAAYCQQRIVLAWCDLTGENEKRPKLEGVELKGNGKYRVEAYEGINAKTIASMILQRDEYAKSLT